MVDPDVVFPTRYMAVAMNIPAFFLGGAGATERIHTNDICEIM